MAKSPTSNLKIFTSEHSAQSVNQTKN